jgi:hypothetical protein
MTAAAAAWSNVALIAVILFGAALLLHGFKR